jgi:hypothetical protein
LKNGVNEENTPFSQLDNQNLSNFWLTPEKVDLRQSGVKGNFYAPFVGEGKRATAFSYPTKPRKGILRNDKYIILTIF